LRPKIDRLLWNVKLHCHPTRDICKASDHNKAKVQFHKLVNPKFINWSISKKQRESIWDNCYGIFQGW